MSGVCSVSAKRSVDLFGYILFGFVISFPESWAFEIFFQTISKKPSSFGFSHCNLLFFIFVPYPEKTVESRRNFDSKSAYAVPSED